MLLRNQQMDDFFSKVISDATLPQIQALEPEIAKFVVKGGSGNINRQYLDKRLIVATKLKRRFFLIGMDGEKKMKRSEVFKILMHIFSTPEKNEEAADIAEEFNIMCVGDESIMRYLHKLELFLNSNLYHVSSVLKRARGGQASDVEQRENEKEELVHTMMKIWQNVYLARQYLKAIGLNEEDFLVLSFMYLEAKPMTKPYLIQGLRKFTARDRVIFKATTLTRRKYIEPTLLDSQFVKVEETAKLYRNQQRKIRKAWQLTTSGHEAIGLMLKRMTIDL